MNTDIELPSEDALCARRATEGQAATAFARAAQSTLHKLVERINADDEVYALWNAPMSTPSRRLGMTDHGPVHVHIIANIALKLMRLLIAAGIQPPLSATTL